MIRRLQKLTTEISDGIPSAYHKDLEDRLAIVWGERKRHRSRDKPQPKAKTESDYRKNRARTLYLKVQDKNAFFFLPFVLAYSPRACADIKIIQVDQLLNYGRDQVYVDKTKELIEGMAIRRGFSTNPIYLAFMKEIFPEGSRKPEAIVEAVDLTTRQNSTVAPVTSISSPNSPTTIPGIPLNDPVQQHKVLEHASLQGIADVFNKYICDVIKGEIFHINGTTYLKAAITMTFPQWAILDCVMSLVIHESKVEDLAKALFNVQVVSERNVRYLILPGGVRVTPNPDLTLKGVPDQAIIHVFGLEVYAAVAASSLREQELVEGVKLAQGVSMILPKNSSDKGVVNLTLGIKGAVQIRNKIYP
ncbi:hypothetical protein BGZ60DRAFT_513784 [Tricladium varicosporioides]|nr:hypothetical protein BGZ60DRAFT_513784 [Hymenoscyphus varicosporioides]